MDDRMDRWVLRTKVKDANGEMFEADDLLEFWRRGAAGMCEVFLEALLNVGGRFESCATTPRHHDALLNVVECYVVGGLQDKLLREGVSTVFAEEDEETARILERVAHLPLQALGLDARCAHVVNDTCIRSMLESLRELSCPIHMASQISECVRLAQRDARGVQMGADDLLSLLVVLVAAVRPTQVYSLVLYIETFHSLISNARKGEQGFALANFCGAVRFARSDAMLKILEEHGSASGTASA
jgi:hypothetical protein